MFESESNYDLLDIGWDQFAKFAISLKTSVKLIANFDKTIFEDNFKLLDNNESRIKYCINNEFVMNGIEKLYENIVNTHMNSNYVHKKNAFKSKQLREEGNQCFRNGFYKKCIDLYSSAICLAPFPSETCSPEERIELSMAFANRSAALFRVEDYESCLLDIEDAIRFEYPNDMKSKLLLRKAQSLASLGKQECAKQVIHDLNQTIANNKNNDKIKEEIEVLLNTIENNVINEDNIDINDESNDSDSIESNDKIENCNPLVPKASHNLNLSYNPIKGRFITAINDIKFGETLLIEYPFATYLHFDKFDSYCSQCLTALENRSVPCFGCNQIRFCDEKCRDEAWTQFHQFECHCLLSLLKEMGISYIVLRIVLKTGIKEAIKVSKEMSQQIEHKNEGSHSGDYSSVISLLNHEKDHNLESMLSYSLTACFALYALQQNSFIRCDDEDYLYLGALLLKHIQQLSTNLISILEQNIFEEFNKFGLDAKEDIIGTAIYPTVSLLNHSCDPNVLTFFRGSLLTVKASRSIKAGDEVNYCYGPNYQGMSRKDRQTKLKNQYYFDCQCFVCSNRKENLTRALLCQQCNGPVIHNEDYSSQCLSCKSTQLDVRQVIDNIEKGLKFSMTGTDFLERQTYSEALINLHKADELFTLNLYIQNRQLSKSKDDMCKCYALMGHFDRALKYCQQSLRITSLIFGEQSTELLAELIKFISLKWEVVDETLDTNDRRVVANELMEVIKRADNLMSKFLSTTGFENAFKAELQYLNEKKLAVLEIV